MFKICWLEKGHRLKSNRNEVEIVGDLTALLVVTDVDELRLITCGTSFRGLVPLAAMAKKSPRRGARITLASLPRVRWKALRTQSAMLPRTGLLRVCGW